MRQTGRISSKTHYDFLGKQMSAFGGVFIIGSLIERLNLYQLLSTQLTVKRKTKVPFDKLMVAMVHNRCTFRLEILWGCE
jgi:hypothetical protein